MLSLLSAAGVQRSKGSSRGRVTKEGPGAEEEEAITGEGDNNWNLYGNPQNSRASQAWTHVGQAHRPLFEPGDRPQTAGLPQPHPGPWNTCSTVLSLTTMPHELGPTHAGLETGKYLA